MDVLLKNQKKIVFIDELDEEDNVNRRMEETDKFRNTNLVKPEVEWLADGVVQVEIFLPLDQRTAEFAAIEFAKK